MYKHLSFLPSYVLPSQIMATTLDQIKNCTTGTLSIISGGATGGVSKDRTLAGTLVTSSVHVQDLMDYFADPDIALSQLI